MILRAGFCLAALGAALPARAQVSAAAEARVVPLPAAAVPAPLHPALLSPDGPAGAPLAGLLTIGAARIAAAARTVPAAEAAAPTLLSLAAGEPVERAAAGALARALSGTRDAAALMLRMPELIHGALPALAGRRLPLGAAATLAESARRDPSIAFLFDGRDAPAVDVPAGAVLDGEELVAGGLRAAPLGRGAFGLVHPHPSVEGAVIKIDLPRNARPEDLTPAASRARVELDRAAAEEAALVGAGPRVLGGGFVGGRPALVKERVYGATVAELLASGRFGPEEHALVEALFETLAESGKLFFDVGPDNVMIGRTLADARVRAYLADGGAALPPRPGLTVEDAVEELFSRLRQLAHPRELLPAFDRVHFADARAAGVP
jgi:hypothetical protein